MLRLHEAIRDSAFTPNVAENDGLLLKTAGERRVDKLVKQLAELDAMKNRLQRSNANICITKAFRRSMLPFRIV